ncbi:hypothetical protein SBA3_2630009 [Candidatus Sulfopaludibacter sp. SbA3]|nr:hypothetical protein SBA3_2630009 [Candidatus Sulfopaludibacter sp. SbA3]
MRNCAALDDRKIAGATRFGTMISVKYLWFASVCICSMSYAQAPPSEAGIVSAGWHRPYDFRQGD